MYSGFYVIQLVLAFYTMGGFKFKTLLLANASFPIYVKAFFNALRRRDLAWQATNKVSYDSPFNYVRMQVYVFIFLLLTTVVGIWKVYYTDAFSISLAWNALNTFVFGYFTFAALREGGMLRRQRQEVTQIPKIEVTEGGAA
jgi:cellulose synthase (UDP-forming)